MAPLKEEPERFAPSSVAAVRFAPSKFEQLRFAPLKVAALRLALLKFDPLTFAPLKVAARRSDPAKFAPETSCPLYAHPASALFGPGVQSVAAAWNSAALKDSSATAGVPSEAKGVGRTSVIGVAPSVSWNAASGTSTLAGRLATFSVADP